jgi:serine/threonine protein kinase
MAVRLKRTCESCGFENAEPGQDCPLCGVSAADSAATLPPLPDAPTLAAGQTTSRAEFNPAQSAMFGDRYRVLELLGKGGMGDVYRVHDLVDGRDLALKVLRRDAAQTTGGLERFKREIAVLTKLRHPAILHIVDHGVQGADYFFVSEIVHGQDLRVALRQRGVFSVQDALGLAAVVADALAVIHGSGVVHRDLKPANIMMAPDGGVRLVDFGLARPEGMDVERVTRTGEFVGTPVYMSPEQFDARAVDARSDIYSLGVVLFEMLTGHPPFTSASVLAMAMKHLKEPTPAPSASRPDVPPWLDRLVLKCLEKEPSRRFATAALLAEELRRPQSTGRPRPRKLSTGDRVMQSESASDEWPLVLASPAQKPEWTVGVGVRFEDRIFRLVRVDPPAIGGLWTYRFTAWPEGEVIRRLIDYASDASGAGKL